MELKFSAVSAFSAVAQQAAWTSRGAGCGCPAGGLLLYVSPMEVNLIIGGIVIALSLGVLAVLVLWSRRRIERIARMESRSARQISRELRDGR